MAEAYEYLSGAGPAVVQRIPRGLPTIHPELRPWLVPVVWPGIQRLSVVPCETAVSLGSVAVVDIRAVGQEKIRTFGSKEVCANRLSLPIHDFFQFFKVSQFDF